MAYKQSLGSWGEQFVTQHLEHLGWKILERNFRTKFGEIDIIAQDGEEIVFVEVKTRSSQLFGEAKESITRLKQKHLMLSVQSYIKQKQVFDAPYRIDVATLDKHHGNWNLEIIPNAVNYF